MIDALTYRWADDAMHPIARCAGMAKDQFVEGGYYVLSPVEERSKKSHDHQFAEVADAWANLPEVYADRFATPDHLRKWCLVKRGFRNERVIVAASKSQAVEIAALAFALDEFAVVHINGNIVTVYTAKTQKMLRNDNGGMDKDEFQAAKQAVLEECAFMIGVSVDDLKQMQGPSLVPHQRRARQSEDA
jgi:hypothetical protein